MKFLTILLCMLMIVPLFGSDVPTPPKDSDYTQQILDTSVGVGQSNAELLVYGSWPVPIRGSLLTVTYDADQIDVTDVQIEGTDSRAFTGGIEPDFDFRTINDDGVHNYVVIVTLWDVLPPFEIIDVPPVGLASLGRIVFDVNPVISAGTELDIRLEGGVGDPVLNNNYTVQLDRLVSKHPLLINGAVTVKELPLFIRGDFNNSGRLDLADAIGVLKYLFAQADKPECKDSADANDDGNISISDAITVLRYLFVNGPPPKAPFPLAGIDPTQDDLDCDI